MLQMTRKVDFFIKLCHLYQIYRKHVFFTRLTLHRLLQGTNNVPDRCYDDLIYMYWGEN